LLESLNPRLRFRVTFRKCHQNTDPTFTRGLLRARRKRPRGRSADEKRGELTALHCQCLPVLRTKDSTALLRDFNLANVSSGSMMLKKPS
jgi:hypothetical protein